MGNYERIVERNYKGEEGSFIFELHENSCFDEVLFKELLKALYEIVNKSKERTLEREVVIQISKIQSYVLSSIIYHHHKNDLYKIKNYQEDKISSFIETLNIMIECYLSGNKIDECFIGIEF